MMEPHQLINQEQEPPLRPPSRNPENYCIDCAVTFESNTSLQVHLTYHKENLLTRWGPARQSQGTSTTLTRTASTTSTVKTTMEPKSEHTPPTVASPHYTTQSQQFSQSYSPFAQALHFLPPQQNQFSPNQYDEARIGQRIAKERNPGETPAEILDLDSNRVHLYNIQQEQHFYRPYLMSHPPPPLPSVANGGWSQAPPQDLYHTSPFHPQDIYNRNLNPPPHNVIYNYVQPESTSYPASALPEPVSMGFQGQQPQLTQQALPSQLQQSNVSLPSPAAPPKTPTEKKQKKSEGGVDMRGKGKGGECKRPKSYECTSCNKWFTSSGHLKRHYGTALHKNAAQQNGSEGAEPVIGPGRGKGKRKSKKEKKMNLSDSNSSEQMDLTGPTSPHRRHMPMTGTSTEDSKSMNAGTGENGSGRQEESQLQPPPPIHTLHGQSTPATPPPPQPTYLYVTDPQFLGQPHHHHTHFPTHHFDPTILYSQHPPSIYNNNSGYPTMEVPLPPFSSVTLSHYAPEPPAYHEQNGNNEIYPQEPRTPPPPEPQTSKKEPVDESPEVGRGSGFSPHSSASWLSPAEASPENSSSRSPSSGNESLESIGELPIASLDETLPSDDTKTQLIKCPHCSKTFSRTCYLTQHHNSSHSGKSFKCPLCGKKFRQEPALSDHVAKHRGNKPYKCQLCPKEFNHKTDLRRHFCLHTGQKPFMCRDCGKGFIRKDHMTKHAEVHRKGTRSSAMTLSPPTME